MPRESTVREIWRCRWCGTVVRAVLRLKGAECPKGHAMKRIWELGQPELEEADLAPAGKG